MPLVASPGSPGITHSSQTWVEELLGELGARRVGRKWQCPVHGRSGEHSVALAVGTRDDGTGAWMRCHAGCSLDTVLRALALAPAHLRLSPPVAPGRHREAHRLRVGFPAPRSTGSAGPTVGYRHEAYHEYRPPRFSPDPAWLPHGPLQAMWRKERRRRPSDGDKIVSWEARNPAGAWIPGLLGAREASLPLYRQDGAYTTWLGGGVVVLVESESSVDALRGVQATTWAGGSSSPPLELLVRLFADGCGLVMIADADDAGRRCAARISEALPAMRVIEPETEGHDARDLYAELGGPGFAALVGATFHDPVPDRPRRRSSPIRPRVARSRARAASPLTIGPGGTFAETVLARVRGLVA